MSVVQINSEVGTLKQVLLHRPGSELEHLVPGELERLLFDDIPFLRTARWEHQVFADTLKNQGAEVIYIEDLAAQVVADPSNKEEFVKQFVQEGGVSPAFQNEVVSYLMAIQDPLELILKTMSGVTSQELDIRDRRPLSSLVDASSRFVLDPIPNLYFTRDPFAFIAGGVSLNRMFSVTRRRETIYGQYILERHPLFRGQVPFYYDRDLPYSIEGGDILVLTPQVIAVGLSQRTSAEAVEVLAKRLFEDPANKIRTILAISIPSLRAFMHLDTVCTQLDKDKFVVHPGIQGNVRIFEVTPASQEGMIKARELNGSLQEVFAWYLGEEKVDMINCGAGDKVAAEREQWNDGSNVVAVKPGTVIAYERNVITNQVLRENGIEVLEIPGSELSRGRGGPRCMTMPLYREE